MATLDFHGPFHFDDIDKNGQIKPTRNPNKSPNPDKPGIYIWGFMYYYDANGLTVPVDFNKIDISFNENKMKFIPYYVGMRIDNIYNRLNVHYNIRKGHARKYIRLSENYMKVFFKDPSFPLKIKRKHNNQDVSNLIKQSSGKIEYFNDKNCLLQIYPNISIKLSGKKQTDCLITEQMIGTTDLPDTLSNLINLKNNFWFCYAIKPYNSPISLEELETYTFWSLKGLTVSQTGCCPLPSPSITIIDNTNTNIFKKHTNTNLINPSNQFNGY